MYYQLVLVQLVSVIFAVIALAIILCVFYTFLIAANDVESKIFQLIVNLTIVMMMLVLILLLFYQYHLILLFFKKNHARIIKV